MNKIILSVFASLFLFACSNNDDQTVSDDQGGGGLKFEITASTKSSDGLKAGTPLYSQEATQHVTRVSIYAFKQNGADYTYAKTYDVSGWTDGLTSKVYTVADSDKLPAGNYKFLVVGRPTADDYTVTAPTAATKFEDLAAKIAATGNESEIFAGWAQAQVLDNGARVSVTITRKVAGVLGYFKNIPQTLNGNTVKYLRLTVNATNLQTSLSTGLGSVAGTVNYNLINLDLSTQTVTDGLYTGNTITGVTKVANSQLWGAYLIPATGVSLTLGLYSDTDAPIKTWTVKSGSATSFDILANNFYSLGRKLKVDTTDGVDPTDPDDDDDPIDLLSDETITITISPAWIINYLSIE